MLLQLCRFFVGNFEITAKEKDETVYSNNGWWQKNALKNNAILKVPGWIQSVRVLISNHTSNYKDEFKYCRTAFRQSFNPNNFGPGLGLRLVCQ